MNKSKNFSRQQEPFSEPAGRLFPLRRWHAYAMLMKGQFQRLSKRSWMPNRSVHPGQKEIAARLEDKSIDAIYIATPDHWHSPLNIMGCQAGKHVYVEKPLSHSPRESESAIAAARKYDRIVQMGAQRRSAPILSQGIDQLHKGIIGRVYLAKTWYTNNRKLTKNPGSAINNFAH